jgi:hypothetical protein
VPRVIVRLEGLGQMKKQITSLRIEPRDLPACSIVPQPTMLPRVPQPNRRMINERRIGKDLEGSD